MQFGTSTVAPEVPLRIELDQVVVFVAGVAAGEADAGAPFEAFPRFRNTSQTGVQRLTLHVALKLEKINLKSPKL